MSQLEREERKARMQLSNWIAAAEGGSREFIPISSTPLDEAYLKSKSLTRSAYLSRLETGDGRQRDPSMSLASDFIAAKDTRLRSTGSAGPQHKVLTQRASIQLGYDPVVHATSNSVYGVTSALPSEEIDLLQQVPNLRDTTLDGAHRASMTEGHFLSIWDPYVSAHPIRSASFRSASLLKDAHNRHARSQYHPDEKYTLPPTVQNDIGWGLTIEKYRDACSKYQDGAEFHGRTGSHITKFSERLQLGARHHLSGPMTNPKLHY